MWIEINILQVFQLWIKNEWTQKNYTRVENTRVGIALFQIIESKL